MVVPVPVHAVAEDPANLDIDGLFRVRKRRVERVNVVGPLETNGERCVGGPGVVGTDGLDSGNGGEVLDEDYGAGSGMGGGVVYYRGEEEATDGGDPDVGAAAATGDLGGGGEGEAGGQFGEEFGVSKGWMGLAFSQVLGVSTWRWFVLLEEAVGAGNDLPVHEGITPGFGIGFLCSELAEAGVVDGVVETRCFLRLRPTCPV